MGEGCGSVGADDLGSPPRRTTPQSAIADSDGLTWSQRVACTPSAPCSTRASASLHPAPRALGSAPPCTGAPCIAGNQCPPCVREGGSRSETEGLSSFTTGRRGRRPLRCQGEIAVSYRILLRMRFPFSSRTVFD